MKAMLILYNVIFAFLLFLLNGLLGKLQYGVSGPLFRYGKFTFGPMDEQSFSGNFFQKIVNPTVYLAIIAAVTQCFLPSEFLEALWLLIPIFWLFRAGFMLLKNVFPFLNLKYEAAACLLSLALGEGSLFGIILPLARQNEPIMIPVTALRDALWFAILAYLLKTAWEIMRNLFEGESLYPGQSRDRIVMKRYHKFSKKFGKHILDTVLEHSSGQVPPYLQEQAVRLVYAVMIYEDYNRPVLIRFGERFLKATLFRRRTMSLGIMQVQTSQPISDRESISRAVPILLAPFLEGQNDPIDDAISAYNPDDEYFSEVSAIYNILAEYIPFDCEAPMG